MRRKRKQTNSSTPTSETLTVPPSSNASTGTTQPRRDAHTENTRTTESSVEPKERTAQELSQSPRSGRKRRRRRKKSTAPTNESHAIKQKTDSEETASIAIEQAAAPPASEAESSANHPKRKRRRRKKSSAASAAIAETALTNEVHGEQVDATSSDETSSVEPSSKPRKRRRKRRQGGAAKSTPQAPVEVAPRPKVIWPDPKPPNWIATADNRLAYTPEFVPGPAPKLIPHEDEAPASAVTEEHSARTSEDVTVKVCLYCGETKPLSDFLRRTGKKSGNESRRGACRDCRKHRRAARLADDVTSDPLPLPLAAGPAQSLDLEEDVLETIPKRRFRRPPPEPPEDALLEPTREVELRTTKQGTIRMRGRTDKGRRWQQETDLEMARCLVREHAAVVVNRFTIRRLYTNRSFRRYILERDRYTCHFCGEYGDTIDHLLPRAKGGHTTPLNCVCACMLCNQNKADRDLDEFMEDAEPLDDLPLGSGFERRPIEH